MLERQVVTLSSSERPGCSNSISIYMYTYTHHVQPKPLIRIDVNYMFFILQSKGSHLLHWVSRLAA